MCRGPEAWVPVISGGTALLVEVEGDQAQARVVLGKPFCLLCHLLPQQTLRAVLICQVDRHHFLQLHHLFNGTDIFFPPFQFSPWHGTQRTTH